MIDFVLDLMDDISDGFCKAFSDLVDFGKYIGVCLAYMILILTIPIWIVPLRIWRRRRR